MVSLLGFDPIRMPETDDTSDKQQPTPGKRLLVLDLDYCILDTALWKESNFVAEREPGRSPVLRPR